MKGHSWYWGVAFQVLCFCFLFSDFINGIKLSDFEKVFLAVICFFASGYFFTLEK